jgi:predicted MFS family arabinose efflux permease
MIIGADQALLFDATRNDTTYAKDWGRASFFALMGTAAAGIFGPMLYNKHFRLPYLFSALPFLLAALVFLFFQEKHHSSDFSWKTYWHNNTEGLKLAFKNRHVRWATGVLALTFGAMYTFTNSYQPYLTSVGFDVKTFSLILPGMFLLEALGGAVSGKLYEKFGDRPVFILGLLILAATLAILGLYPHKVAIVLLFAFNLLLGIVNPVTSAYTNRYVGGELRATIISAQAVVATVSAALMLFLFGLLTDKVGLNNLLIILAVIIFVAGGLLLLNQPKEKSS